MSSANQGTQTSHQTQEDDCPTDQSLGICPPLSATDASVPKRPIISWPAKMDKAPKTKLKSRVILSASVTW